MKRACRRRGHDWFPNLGQREFVPTEDICWRCGEKRVLLPYGMCLGGHPLAEHYPDGATPQATVACLGPS